MSDSGLNEPSYDVQVILSDLQDTDNPLSSAKTFQDLNLSVASISSRAMGAPSPTCTQRLADITAALRASMRALYR